MVDASLALSALLSDGPARRVLATERLHAPHLVDHEVASGLRRKSLAGQIEDSSAVAALRTWQRMGINRYPGFPLLERVWELRQNVSAYDASYVALAELLDCALVTGDARLARAPGIRCVTTVVPG
ncbi:putative nucleic acid-binding protein [Pseudonocardia sediminis]|uniref:Ribonuclease VapC n=1 Tax=Pseudonocardia sediminis TaxID=1397368 RepID=A0A4Q7V2F4_PSEST|nr:putative nucleic acid-binding protein [Pseudonocardia sediminis]